MICPPRFDATTLIADLVDIRPIKTWSLIVTILGDGHRTGSTALSGAELKEFLDPIGVRPEAVRVALHRLKKDGWIVSERTGRETHYHLAPNALQQTISAYEDVYRGNAKYADGWSIAVFDQDEAECPGGVPITRNTGLVPNANTHARDNALIANLENHSVPDWMLQKIFSDQMIRTAQILLSVVTEIKEHLADIDMVKLKVIRILVLHHWRRLALRNETWLHCWLEPDGIVSQCHIESISLINTHQSQSANTLRSK